MEPTCPERDALPRGFRIVEWGTFALLLFAPIALGTVHLETTAVVAGGGALLLGVLALTWTRPSQIVLTPFGVVLLVLALYTGLQAVPMPSAWVAVLSPAAATVHREAAAIGPAAAVTEPAWMTLSLSPGATWQSFMKLLGLLSLFVIGTSYFGRDVARRRRLLSAVVISGVAVVVLGFLARLLFDDGLLGLPALPSRRFVGTFVNPNHLAGFLGLCVPVAVGMAVDARPAGKRLTLVCGAVLLAVGVFMTLSRGGIVVFVAGQAILVWLLLLGRQNRSSGRGQTVWVPLVALTAVGTSLGLAYSSVMAQVETIVPTVTASLGGGGLPPDVRAQVWTDLLPLIRDFPVAGIGSGAFAEVYPGYKTVVAPYTFTHAESEYLQSVCEWGLFGWLLIGACAVTGWLAFGVALRRARDPGSFAGLTAALFAVAAHNAVDFNLETGGVAVPAVLLLAVACAYLPGKLRFGFRAPVWVGAGVAALGLMTVAFILSSRGSLRADTERLAEAESLPTVSYLEVAADVLKRHPADYLLPLAVGNRYLRPGPGRNVTDALYWIRRAMSLNPTHATAHVLAARILAEMGKPELAAGEYQLAYALDRRMTVHPDARAFVGRGSWSEAETAELVKVLVGRGTQPEKAADGSDDGRTGPLEAEEVP